MQETDSNPFSFNIVIISSFTITLLFYSYKLVYTIDIALEELVKLLVNRRDNYWMDGDKDSMS